MRSMETNRGPRTKSRERDAGGMTYLEPDREALPADNPATPADRPSGEVHIDEWVAPDACDDRGFLRPGKILEWMDAVGALAATRFARAAVATISVDGVNVRRQIAAGDRVAMRARVVHTSARSIGVAITMTAGPQKLALDAFMTFVVVGDDGRAAPVARFHPETPEDAAGHREGEARARFRRELAVNRSQLVDLAGDQPPPAPASDAGFVLLLRELGARLVGRARIGGDVRAAGVSYVHKIEPVRHGKLNFHGTLYGGTLMRWLETCAAMSASAFLSTPPRLMGVDGLTFLRPVAPNVFVHLDAIAVHSDEHGVTVMVRALSEDPLSSSMVQSLRGFFTYAPVVATTGVPQLARGGRDDALFCEVVLRHRLRDAIAELRS
jgi:acyl-CoA hydrolase